MGKEIERKFLVNDESYKPLASKSCHIMQGYLSVNPDSTVRVRIKDNDAYITVKTRNRGAVRNEWEYPIPIEDAREMLAEATVTPVIDKVRHIVGRWEIDEFHGALEGLTVAEIELTSESEPFEIPSFIGREVTGDCRYYNSSLTQASELPPTR